MSEIGKIFHPLFAALAYLIAVFYSWWPSYAFAISMLTVAVMVVLAPLTIKSTRSMLAMQRLAPELKKIQQKYKNDRQRLNEEMMAFYKEHGINPLGGCLPTLLQLPVFFVMYDVIEGLTNKVGPHHVPSPKYISHSTLLYHHLIADNGKMVSFGLDLAKSVTSVAGDLTKLPYAGLILLAIALQYIQIRQLNGRNPQAAAANPQAQTVQKIMPLVFAIIYISIPAGVNVYFVVSSLFRIVQQELMYRFDPAVKSALVPLGAGAGGADVVDAASVEAERSDAGRAPSAARAPRGARPPEQRAKNRQGTNGAGPGSGRGPRSPVERAPAARPAKGSANGAAKGKAAAGEAARRRAGQSAGETTNGRGDAASEKPSGPAPPESSTPARSSSSDGRKGSAPRPKVAGQVAPKGGGDDGGRPRSPAEIERARRAQERRARRAR
jgi:YidC/Oxa1 family membrane protein insertase